MGNRHSQHKYSFQDQFDIIENNPPNSGHYKLQNRQSRELFIGRELACNDENQAYQIQCIVHEKLNNPSPFVTRLIKSESEHQQSYCSNSNRFYLLYKDIPKLLAEEIKQRQIQGRPFSIQQIDTVINRVAKGLKYLYDIYHHHGTVSAKTITWPMRPKQRVQLVDEWIVPSNNVQIKSKVLRPKDQEDMQQKNLDKSLDLYNLGLVAKQMLQTGNGHTLLSTHPNYNQITTKIQVLTAPSNQDRTMIYNMINLKQSKASIYETNQTQIYRTQHGITSNMSNINMTPLPIHKFGQYPQQNINYNNTHSYTNSNQYTTTHTAYSPITNTHFSRYAIGSSPGLSQPIHAPNVQSNIQTNIQPSIQPSFQPSLQHSPVMHIKQQQVQHQHINISPSPQPQPISLVSTPAYHTNFSTYQTPIQTQTQVQNTRVSPFDIRNQVNLTQTPPTANRNYSVSSTNNNVRFNNIGSTHTHTQLSKNASTGKINFTIPSHSLTKNQSSTNLNVTFPKPQTTRLQNAPITVPPFQSAKNPMTSSTIVRSSSSNKPVVQFNTGTASISHNISAKPLQMTNSLIYPTRTSQSVNTVNFTTSNNPMKSSLISGSVQASSNMNMNVGIPSLNLVGGNPMLSSIGNQNVSVAPSPSPSMSLSSNTITNPVSKSMSGFNFSFGQSSSDQTFSFKAPSLGNNSSGQQNLFTSPDFYNKLKQAQLPSQAHSIPTSTVPTTVATPTLTTTTRSTSPPKQVPPSLNISALNMPVNVANDIIYTPTFPMAAKSQIVNTSIPTSGIPIVSSIPLTTSLDGPAQLNSNNYDNVINQTQQIFNKLNKKLSFNQQNQDSIVQYKIDGKSGRSSMSNKQQQKPQIKPQIKVQNKAIIPIITNKQQNKYNNNNKQQYNVSQFRQYNNLNNPNNLHNIHNTNIQNLKKDYNNIINNDKYDNNINTYNNKYDAIMNKIDNNSNEYTKKNRQSNNYDYYNIGIDSNSGYGNVGRKKYNDDYTNQDLLKALSNPVSQSNNNTYTNTYNSYSITSMAQKYPHTYAGTETNYQYKDYNYDNSKYDDNKYDNKYNKYDAYNTAYDITTNNYNNKYDTINKYDDDNTYNTHAYTYTQTSSNYYHKQPKQYKQYKQQYNMNPTSPATGTGTGTGTISMQVDNNNGKTKQINDLFNRIATISTRQYNSQHNIYQQHDINIKQPINKQIDNHNHNHNHNHSNSNSNSNNNAVGVNIKENIEQQQQQSNNNTNNNNNTQNSRTTPAKYSSKSNQPFSTIPQVSQKSASIKSDQDKDYVIEEYQNGSRYQGYKTNGMRNGKGKFFYQQGSYYDGQWKNNNMHGYGKLYYSNKKLAYQGEWFIDQFHGHGKVYNDQPAPIYGTYDYTNFDSLEQKWNYYEGDLVCDSKEGMGKLVLSNQQFYQGQFRNDKVDGKGRFVTKNGQIVQGVWQDSKLIKKF